MPSSVATCFGAAANSGDVAQRLANLVLSLLPNLEDRGLVASGELDAQTLAQQIVDDVAASASFVIAGSEVTAHTRVPDRATDTSKRARQAVPLVQLGPGTVQLPLPGACVPEGRAASVARSRGS